MSKRIKTLEQSEYNKERIKTSGCRSLLEQRVNKEDSKSTKRTCVLPPPTKEEEEEEACFGST